MTAIPLPATGLALVLGILLVALLPALARLVRGPSLPDRVVSLDVMATTGIAIAAVYAILAGQPALLDVAIVVALVSFLGTVAFATYLERRS